MAQPTVVEVFGANATQDATTLTITKADYATSFTFDGVDYGGLTAAAGNNGEQLFLAILMNAMKSKLNNTQRLLDFDISTVIVNNGQDIVTQNSQTYRRHAFSVQVFIAENLVTLDPDNV